jgi:leucyl-tRNA synthetase
MPGTISLASWPAYDPAQLKDANVEVPVQIAGKVRHRITVPADLSAAELQDIALADDKVKELLVGKTVRKVVVIPNKLVNIVAN